MSEDPEIAKIMQKKLEEMLKQKNEPKIEPGIIDLNASNFDKVISAENPTLVDFWAEWCGPCKMIGPVVEELASEYAGRAVVGKVDVDNNPAVSAKFGIRSIPTLLVFKRGEVVDKQIGAVPKSVLSQKLDAQVEASV